MACETNPAIDEAGLAWQSYSSTWLLTHMLPVFPLPAAIPCSRSVARKIRWVARKIMLTIVSPFELRTAPRQLLPLLST